MATTRRAPAPLAEKIRLINECRKSGLTDADWCREHGIAPSTFYNWVSRCRKIAPDKIQEPAYGHIDGPHPKQDIVAINIVSDPLQEYTPVAEMPQQSLHLDNSHTMEISFKQVTLRINNQADPILLARTLRILQEALC